MTLVFQSNEGERKLILLRRLLVDEAAVVAS